MDVSILKGKTLIDVVVNKNDVAGYDFIVFKVSDLELYKMYHEQDCCESVTIEDIYGDVNWLIGSPILVAEMRCNNEDGTSPYFESKTWTFYEIATLKGSVTIRWYGTSNGYYSEEVIFEYTIDMY